MQLGNMKYHTGNYEITQNSFRILQYSLFEEYYNINTKYKTKQDLFLLFLDCEHVLKISNWFLCISTLYLFSPTKDFLIYSQKKNFFWKIFLVLENFLLINDNLWERKIPFFCGIIILMHLYVFNFFTMREQNLCPFSQKLGFV